MEDIVVLSAGNIFVIRQTLALKRDYWLTHLRKLRKNLISFSSERRDSFRCPEISVVALIVCSRALVLMIKQKILFDRILIDF